MRILALAVLLLVLSLGVSAQGWVSKVVVLGDSLSDTGRFWTAIGSPSGPPWPYPGPRASNGPVAVEVMAAKYGVDLDNHAWFGATTGLGNYRDGGSQLVLHTLPGVTTEFQWAKAGGLEVDPQAVYVLWAGPNDFLTDGFEAGTITRAVTNLVLIARELEAKGAKHILVPGMPDLGLTPFLRSTEFAGQASMLTDIFNAALAAGLPRKANFFDTAGWMRQIIAHPAAYGYTNVTGQCFNLGTWTACSTPDTYFFWDDFHPTARTHSILGGLFAQCAQTRSGGHSALCRAGLGIQPK